MAVGIEGDRLLIDVGIDIVEAPVAEALALEPASQTRILVSGGVQTGGRVIDGPEDSQLGLELFDDRQRRALELESADPTAQVIDLDHVLVHKSSLLGLAALWPPHLRV